MVITFNKNVITHNYLITHIKNLLYIKCISVIITEFFFVF